MPFLLGTLVAAFPLGCSLLPPTGDPTRFYVLSAPHRTTARSADANMQQLRVGLAPVELSAYLRTKNMIVRRGANELDFEEFARWAEPLDQGIGRLMQESLVAAENVGSVAQNAHGDDSLDCLVFITISACEGARTAKGDSSIQFQVHWEIRAVGNQPAAPVHGGFNPGLLPWDGRHYAQLAERLGEAIAKAGAQLAAELPGATAPRAETMPP